MRKYLTIIIPIFISIITNAQTSITGRVLDENNKGLDYYGVQITKTIDSTIVFTSFFATDKFNIKLDSFESSFLIITCYGYKDKVYKLDQPKQYDLGNIHMEPAPIALGEVEITGRVPLITNKADRIIVNVQNSLLSEASDGMEMLQKTPGLIRTNNSIQIAGKGTPIIYIDKKRANSLEEVAMLNPQNIKSIEVIDNPPASFEADGSAVIIINTIKRTEDDYFRVGGDITAKRKISENAYIEGNKRFSNLLTSLYYGASNNNSKSYEKNIRETNPNEILKSNATSLFNRKAHQFRTSFDYSLTSEHQIGLQVNAYTDKGTLKRNELTSNLNNTLEDFITVSKNKLSSTEFSGILYYSWKIDTLGQKLDITTDYSQYNDKSDRDYYNIKDNSNTPFMNNNYNKNKNGIYTITGDYYKPISKTFQLESGIKFYSIKRVSDTNLSGSLDLIQNYTSYEKNMAAYVSGMIKLNPDLSIKLGVRAENNYRKGYKDDNKYIDTVQLNIFPSLNVNYKYRENRSVGFAYSSRISRPTFSSLDPSVNADSLMNRMGNPELKSTIIHSFQASINPFKSLIFKTSYSYYSNPIYFMVSQDKGNPNMTNVRFSNGNNMHSYSISAMYNTDLFKIWSISLYSSYWQEFYKYMENEVEKTNDVPGLYLSIQNSFKLPYEIFTDIGFYYTKGSANGTFVSGDNSNLYGTIRRSFSNNKLRMSLSANDILHKTMTRQRSLLEGGNLNIYNGDNTYVRFSISYQIGKSSYKRKEINSDEINRL